jgi:uncharacterized protein YlbG (UPF0298 family)
MSDNGVVKESISGVTRWKKKSRKAKLMWMYCTENDLKSMGVKRWKKISEVRSASAIVRKEVLTKLLGPSATEREKNEELAHIAFIKPITIRLCSLVVSFLPGMVVTRTL